jgi:hypothetical protein
MKPARLPTLLHLCVLVLLVSPPVSLLAGEAKREGKGLLECKMTFSLKGWSAFYKTTKGDGTITCSNGQRAKVKIAAKGGGITFGKSEIIGGTGTFTEVGSIAELFGSYVQSEAHAGAGKSGDVQAMTKGEVSLALAGTGRGIDIGFAFGKFTITRAQ